MLVLDMIYVDWIKKKIKNLQVLWDVFLMLWTLWGLGRDITYVVVLLSFGDFFGLFTCSIWWRSSQWWKWLSGGYRW